MKRRSVRGSVLVYSIILLSIILSMAIGAVLASVANVRSASSSEKSANAFQVADSGAQKIVAEIRAGATILSGLGDCAGGTISDDILQGIYDVQLFSGERGSLSRITSCGASVANITMIRSVGTYGRVSRAVEVFIAP